MLAFLRKEVPSWPDRREIEQLLRPCITLSPGHPRKNDYTRIGGTPDLPDDVSWPRHQGAPLSFVMQIDLREVHQQWSRWDDVPCLLPSSGALFVFLNREDTRVHRLIHTAGFGAMRRAFPSELTRAQQVKNASLRPVRVLGLPRYDDTVYYGDEPREELLDLIQNLQHKLKSHVGGNAGGYQMLGYANSWGEDVMTVLARRRIKREGSGTNPREFSRTLELLLEFQLDDGTDYTNTHRWGRGGFYWALTREELARGELEKADCVFQMNA